MADFNGTANAQFGAALVGPAGSPGAILTLNDFMGGDGKYHWAYPYNTMGHAGYTTTTASTNIPFANFFSYDGDFVPQNGLWTVDSFYLSVSGRVKSYQTADLMTMGFDTTVTITGGTNDMTPPTCSVVASDVNNVTTPSGPSSVSFTVTCTDNGGVGLGKYLLFIGLDATTVGVGATLPSYSNFGTNVVPVTVPLNFKGNLVVQGLLVADLSANMVMYGTCGDFNGGPVCPAGGSSGSSSGGGASSGSETTACVSVFGLLMSISMILFLNYV
jgi:hypothetical protein